MSALKEALHHLWAAGKQDPRNKKIQLAIDIVTDAMKEKHLEEGEVSGKAG
ncbi:MAG: hypothetical protein M0Z65_10800 [Firmicutes bacterium]|uniref:Uncharacterized protein n=1 Tax=Kroppenstedtia guangzhouensis TaxID=1274356 RepID=A0ABQ1GNE0_9BACL|nr:hypothetical protein [Kroppenstedtia guangzhouensis]MDA8353646.1 hypothetical protein [Bacillota bacterium]GGA47015.1 hypothetical protein GCM10007416_20250 [Kroppenstedtia guangzhouensis]